MNEVKDENPLKLSKYFSEAPFSGLDRFFPPCSENCADSHWKDFYEGSTGTFYYGHAYDGVLQGFYPGGES